MTMDTSSDSKKASTTGEQQVHGSPLQSTLSRTSKAAEASAHPHTHAAMATIADDDDRLLVRIGYTPVSSTLLYGL